MKAISKIAYFCADGTLVKAGDIIEADKFDPMTMAEYTETDEVVEEKPKTTKSTKKSNKK